MAICIDKKGEIIDDNLAVNPHCGAGSGINLNRILEKLDINRDSVDKILSDYLGKAGIKRRLAVSVRSDRCGVFSSSATISDKNQGIPLDFALAITMKSEVLKACRKLVPSNVVYLTGRIFKWQYARDCAIDYFLDLGVADVRYDSGQTLLIYGVRHLVDKIGKENIRLQNTKKIRKPSEFAEYPSFKKLKEQYEQVSLYTRADVTNIPDFNAENLIRIPLNIGLDVGSTMAKMAIANADNDEIVFVNSYNNHGAYALEPD
jgi:activator of 2-hydroxyglutaryl-CoA dehydratase